LANFYAFWPIKVKFALSFASQGILLALSQMAGDVPFVMSGVPKAYSLAWRLTNEIGAVSSSQNH